MSDRASTSPPEAAALPVFGYVIIEHHVTPDTPMGSAEYNTDTHFDFEPFSGGDNIAVVKHDDAQAALDTLAAEVGRLTGERDAVLVQRDVNLAGARRLESELVVARSIALEEAAIVCETAPDYLQDSTFSGAAKAIRALGALKATLPDAEAISMAGALMANTMFNLAQKPGHVLTEADCTLFKSMQIKWDAALTRNPSGVGE